MTRRTSTCPADGQHGVPSRTPPPAGLRLAAAVVTADLATGYWRLPLGGLTALRLLLPRASSPPGIVGQRADGLVAFRPVLRQRPVLRRPGRRRA